MTFVKKHKGLIIFLVILIILGIIAFSFVRAIYVSGNEGTLYGSRLDGIDKVRLKDDTLNKIAQDIKKSGQVNSVTHHLEGKILNFTVDVAPEMKLEASKKLAEPILTSLTEDEKAFYDIQVMITCSKNEKSEEYPIMGYKHKTSKNFVW